MKQKSRSLEQCYVPPRGGFWFKIVQVTKKHDPIDGVGIHIDFTSILHSLTPFGPSSLVWSELGPAPPFPPMRALEVKWSRALSVVCEAALD